MITDNTKLFFFFKLTPAVSRPSSSVGLPSVMRIIRGHSFRPLTLTTPPANEAVSINDS